MAAQQRLAPCFGLGRYFGVQTRRHFVRDVSDAQVHEVLGGSWDLVTTSTWAITLLLNELSSMRPARESISLVTGPVIGSYQVP